MLKCGAAHDASEMLLTWYCSSARQHATCMRRSSGDMIRRCPRRPAQRSRQRSPNQQCLIRHMPHSSSSSCSKALVQRRSFKPCRSQSLGHLLCREGRRLCSQAAQCQPRSIACSGHQEGPPLFMEAAQSRLRSMACPGRRKSLPLFMQAVQGHLRSMACPGHHRRARGLRRGTYPLISLSSTWPSSGRLGR